MKRFYEKNKPVFALTLIFLYLLIQNLGHILSDVLGIRNLCAAAGNLILTAVLLSFIRREGLTENLKLGKLRTSGRDFLWFVPLILISSENLWGGIFLPEFSAELVFLVLNMVLVGILEEILIRGFLFEAIAENSENQAVLITTLSFAAGHILNLFNGRGMGLEENLIQIVTALLVGYLYVLILIRGGSLIPCILSHSAIDVLSVFADRQVFRGPAGILLNGIWALLLGGYILLIRRQVPPEKTEKF